MIYNFAQFTLDTLKHELSFSGKIIGLTRQNFELLLFFVENPNKVFSKDDLMDKVWKGRSVTENSIDQSVSKLRKALNSMQPETSIKTVYGKGFIFTSEVNHDPRIVNSKKQLKILSTVIIVTLLFVLLFIGFYWDRLDGNIQHNKPDSLMLIVPTVDDKQSNDWLNQASVTYIDQMLGFTNKVILRDYKLKPKHQNQKDYINNQWKISPQLKIVTTHVSQNNDMFTIKLQVIDALHQQQQQSFSDKNIANLMKAANKWLADLVDFSGTDKNIDSLMPEDSYVLELYLRGLASFEKGEIDKAERLLQLSLDEKPDFYLARLVLAQVISAQGKQDQALAILDTLSGLQSYPQIEIQIVSIRGMIYNIQGRDKENRALYLALLKKYDGQYLPLLFEIKYNLSFTYAKLTEYEAALVVLDEVEKSIGQTTSPELLAKVLQKKASVLQKQGYTKQAQSVAEQSLLFFSKLHDLLGQAKVHTMLARITTHQSNYKSSILHLNQSLAISKKLNYKLGIGATLNELIYVYMVQGQFNKAWLANQEMQKIAIDIDYIAMLQISKQYQIDLSRVQKNWLEAEIYLEEYLQLAQASNSKRSLLKYNLLKIELYLDQDKTEGVMELIEAVQKHIDETQQIRLQARIDKQLARLYLLQEKKDQAIALLLASKENAKKTEDGETIVEINNLLASEYLKSKQAQKALAVLEDSLEYNPVSYPYLLIKSKANQQLGNNLAALDLANQCKATANEWWSLEDERYLANLNSLNQ